MTEGRRSQVVLLDERRLDIVIQPKLYAGELLDIVASHFNLKEKEYFGLAFVDDTGQYSWLQLDRKVLDHDFSKRCSSQATTLILYFLVKYFVESIVQLQDGATVEAFYLQAKSLLFKGELEVDSETLFQLAALVLQATCGDYVDDQISKSHLKRLPVLSTSALKEHPSIAFCEEKVIEHYKKLAGRSRGDAIVNYVSIVETLPTYGQHYYEIKDKTGAAWWLGISYRGISQYDKNDRHTPRRVFLWKQLENLYFRDRKFTIEVHEARRVVHTLSSFNLYEDAIEEPVEEFDDLSNAICDPTTQVSVSRRTLAPANVTVYVWFAATPTVTKCIWSMAIAQHQFFLDRRHRKSQVSAIRSLSQIAAELSRSIQSLSSASSQSNLSRSNSSNSIPAAVLEGELSEESKAAKIEMLTALRARKDALEDALKKKTEELKTLCLKEGELTGELPPETPLHPGEMKPQVRRRIGTSFTLNDKLIYRAKNKERETLNDLELEYEIQSKITSAAFKLANDCTARKSVRKQRKVSYHQATTKLRDIEKKLCTLKKEKECVSKRERKSVNDGLSEESNSHSTDDHDLFEDSGVHLTGLPETLHSSESINMEKTNINNSMLSVTSVPPCSSLPQLTITSPGSAPPSPAKRRQRHQSLQHEPLLNRNQDSEVITYESCTWRTMSTYSAGSEYDTISCGSGSIVSLRVPYRNRFESNLDIEGTNLYSVPNQRASQAFESQDDLLVGVSTNEPSRQVFPNLRQNEFMFHNLSDSAPLSTSYDEKLLYNRSGEEQTSLGSSRSCSNHISFSSAETSSLNCFDSHNQQQVTGQSCRINEKFNHFHSENSLNKAQIDSLCHNLDQTHISEPDLNNPECEKSIPHVYSVPLLRDNFRNKSLNVHLSGTEIYAGANNQSISQVAELVQASMLLQDCKRTASVNSLEYSSPKTKTKEWIETSLDSPLLMRKQKPKYSNYGECEQYLSDPLEAKPQETVFSSKNCGSENIQINISPYLSHPFHQDLLNISPSSNSEINVPHSPSLQYTLSDNHQSTLIDFATLQKVPNTNSSEETTSPISLQSFCFPSTEQQQMFYQRPIYNSVSCLNSEQVPLSIEFSNQHQLYFSSSKNPHHSTSSTLTKSHLSNSSTDDAFLCNQHTNLPNTAEPQQPSKYSLNSNTPLLSKLRTDFHQSDICSSFEQFQETSTIVQEGSAAEPLILTQSLGEEIVGNQQSSRDVSQYISAEQQFINSTSDTQQTYLPTGSQLPTDSWMMPVVASVHETSIPLSPSAPPSFSFPANVEVNVVSLGHFQPYWEETKPYEMADFYKYSTKHRKQQHKTVVKVDISSESDVTDKEDRQNCDWTQMAHNPVHASSTLPEVVENYCHRNEANSVSQDMYTSHQQKKEILVNAHVAVVDHTEYKECTARDSGQEPVQLIMPSSPQSAEDNCSLGEAGLRISLAEAFHEEMLAWYEDQDAMKKATLV